MTEYVKMESAIEVLSGYKFPNAKTEREREVAKSLSSLALNAIPLEDRLRWTPCSEGLPEEDGRYYVTRHDYVTETDFTNILWYEKGLWWNRESTGDYSVIAWMPLPKPYEEGEE